MANMSYCRFQNTVPDLRDCYEALMDIYEISELDSPDEEGAAKRLIKLCQEIARECGELIEDE